MERIRICRETRRSGPAAAVYRAVSAAHRLADLVRSDGESARIPMDIQLYRQTFAERSRHALAPREQSFLCQTAALRSRTALSLPLRAAGRQRLVAPRR